MFYQHLDDFRSAVMKIGISNRELYFWLICPIFRSVARSVM